MKTLSDQIMTKLFKSDSTTQRVVLNRLNDERVEITSKRTINAGKGKLGRIIRFEDGTAIRVTYEIIE